MAKDNHDVWIVIPVYNEGPMIGDVLRSVLATFPHVVCVDDGSRDDSAAQILATNAHLVRHPINLGQGAAIATGMHYALRQPGGRFFVTFDADGQHQVADVITMVDILRADKADVVLGSRFLHSAHTVPPVRRAVLRLVTAISPTARRLKLTDTHNGLRALSRPPAEQLRITHHGMAHASEITGWLARSSWNVVETPVTVMYTDYSRAKGQSLVNGVNILFDVSMSRRGK